MDGHTLGTAHPASSKTARTVCRLGTGRLSPGLQACTTSHCRDPSTEHHPHPQHCSAHASSGDRRQDVAEGGGWEVRQAESPTVGPGFPTMLCSPGQAPGHAPTAWTPQGPSLGQPRPWGCLWPCGPAQISASMSQALPHWLGHTGWPGENQQEQHSPDSIHPLYPEGSPFLQEPFMESASGSGLKIL